MPARPEGTWPTVTFAVHLPGVVPALALASRIVSRWGGPWGRRPPVTNRLAEPAWSPGAARHESSRGRRGRVAVGDCPESSRGAGGHLARHESSHGAIGPQPNPTAQPQHPPTTQPRHTPHHQVRRFGTGGRGIEGLEYPRRRTRRALDTQPPTPPHLVRRFGTGGSRHDCLAHGCPPQRAATR